VRIWVGSWTLPADPAPALCPLSALHLQFCLLLVPAVFVRPCCCCLPRLLPLVCLFVCCPIYTFLLLSEGAMVTDRRAGEQSIQRTPTVQVVIHPLQRRAPPAPGTGSRSFVLIFGGT
jgi:hypothetical protein